ncbi:MAG: MFS transporter [Pseudomonadota bacterium]
MSTTADSLPQLPVPRTGTSPFAVASIIVSMSMIALANGLMFAYVPVKLAAIGEASWVAGAVVTGLAGGGLVGCLATGHIIRRVGHARTFVFLAALVTLSIMVLAIGEHAWIWIASRTITGAAITGLFVVAQSWLNDASSNDVRGRVVAVFYMAYVLCIGIGAYFLRFVTLDSLGAVMLSAVLATLAILPVATTRLPLPPPPEAVNVALRAVWRISPVGLAGLLTVGGMTMLVQGFAPIYMAAIGYGKDDIATLLFLMQFGMLVVQLPLGALSDRIDRRYVLVVACVLVVGCAFGAASLSSVPLWAWITLFGLWGGATETIFAVANAHANDRADPTAYVAVSSTLLIAWSLSGAVLPALTTVLTELTEPRAFMYVVAVTGTLYGLFVVYRMFRKEPTAEPEQEPFQPISAQAPHYAELGPLPPEESSAS